MTQLQTAIHYVVHVVDEPKKLGSTKLAKVLLFADVESFRRTGHTITRAIYKKQPYGPLVEGFNAAIDVLKRDGRIAERKVNHFGYQQRQFWATAEPDVSDFSAVEVAILSELANAICDQETAKSVSDLTHTLAWETAYEGEAIPIPAFLASLQEGTPTHEELAFAEATLAGA